MKVDTSFNMSLYSNSHSDKKQVKLVKSISDFTSVIEQRNKEVYDEIVKHGVNFEEDGTFKSTLGKHIDLYA